MSTSGQLLAGAARVDITPELGVQLAGDIGRYRPTEEIRDQLYANALVLESNDKRICLLSADLLAMGCDWSNRIRNTAAERFEFDPESIMVHAVQNHAAPSLGHLFVSSECTRFPSEYPWLKGGDDRYHEPTVEKCVQATGRALERLEQVTLRVGRGIDGRAAFNRRFIMRDGSARTHPKNCDPEILHAEGPIDPEIGVATLTNADGKVISALLHHTCHPTHGYPHRYVIADWPGAWAEMMREHWGERCVPLVINGCCGNVHHTDHLNPNHTSDCRRMARMLSATTAEVLESTRQLSVPDIDVQRIILRLPLRELTEDEIDSARRVLEEYPEPKWIDGEKTRVDWEWVYAVMILDLKENRSRQPEFEYEIQVFRMGDLAVVTLMGEPFVEGQLKIKLESPVPYTFVAHFCNGYAGYIPTKRAFDGGGYETRTSNGSKFEPGALDAITDAAISLLRRACQKEKG